MLDVLESRASLFEGLATSTLCHEDMNPYMNAVSAGYFSTLGIPLMLGRDFAPGDREGAPLVAIVNEQFARYFFPLRPIVVSPIRPGDFFSEWGLAVIKSELLWVWLPAASVVGVVLIFRRLRGRQPKA